MSDPSVAAPSQGSTSDDGQPDGAGGGRGRFRAGRAAAGRLLARRPVRWGFVVVAVALGGYAVARQWTDVRAALASLGFLAIAGALLAALMALFAALQVWRRLLAALGSPLPARAAAQIMFVGQLGKYLPGSIWPVLAQMELGTAHHVPQRRSASASVLTMLLSLVTGLLTALVALPFAAGPTPYRWAFLAAPLLLVVLYPKVLNFLLNRLLRLARRPALEQPLTGRALAGALVWAFISWIGYGLQIWVLAVRLGASGGTGLLLAVGGFAFAWSVGFLVVFAPAGAGVREVLLIAILGPVIGVGDATAVALVSRVVMTGSDLLTAAAAAWFSPRTGAAAARRSRRGRARRENTP